MQLFPNKKKLEFCPLQKKKALWMSVKARNVSILLKNEYHRLIIYHFFLYKQVVRPKAFLMSAL